MSIKVTFADNETGKAMKKALQPQKYITVRLTEDQANWILYVIREFYTSKGNNDGTIHNFVKRIETKLAKAKS